MTNFGNLGLAIYLTACGSRSHHTFDSARTPHMVVAMLHDWLNATGTRIRYAHDWCVRTAILAAHRA